MNDWVILRGLMRDARHWEGFAQQLSQNQQNARVLTLDFPGNGTRWQEASFNQVSAMADFCEQQAQLAGLSSQLNVLAVSLGAMCALDWAWRYQDRIQQLVLINTSVARYSPFYQRLRSRNLKRLLALLSAPAGLRQEQILLDLTSNLYFPQHQELAQRWASYAAIAPVSRLNILRQLRAAASFQAPPEAPKTDLLILCSQADQLVDPACSAALAHHWHCPLATHPQAGHDLTLDDPAWVIAQIKARWPQA